MQDIQARDQYHAKIEAELAAKKQAVEQATHRVSTLKSSLPHYLTQVLMQHHTNEAQREQRHAVLEHGHESTTPAVGSTAARTDDVTPGYGSATAGDGLATTGTDAAPVGTGAAPVGSATTGGAVPVAERY